MTHDALQCKGSVPDSGFRGSHRCRRNAKRDGYCLTHHPDAVKARRDASTARWQAEYAKKQAMWDRDAANARDAARYRALRNALYGRSWDEIAVLNSVRPNPNQPFSVCPTKPDIDAAVDALLTTTPEG